MVGDIDKQSVRSSDSVTANNLTGPILNYELEIMLLVNFKLCCKTIEI